MALMLSRESSAHGERDSSTIALRQRHRFGETDMAANANALTAETFQFFRELARNNNKAWMDANRGRYRACVVRPFRDLLEQLAPVAAKLDPDILVTGRSGDNFSRINRDIRFARDKTPYKLQMYALFRTLHARQNGGASLYVGASTDGATAGFRNYFEGKESALARVGIPRGKEYGAWVAKQKKRLGRKYESYWYSSEKNDWIKHSGWPVTPEEWKKLKAWIVRRKFPAAGATRANFATKVAKVFRDVFPLYQFTGSSKWKP
jgi:uncharacterized protein (TIGR02453 family)